MAASYTPTNSLEKFGVHPNPVQVIAVTGGKGGVGKTSVAVNLATALGSTGSSFSSSSTRSSDHRRTDREYCQKTIAPTD